MPLICTGMNIAFTDMSLEIKHWWISFLISTPLYMIFNWVGSLDFYPERGGIYGFEYWKDNIPLTIFIFLIGGTCHGLIHVISAWAFSKCKRSDGWDDEEQTSNNKVFTTSVDKDKYHPI